MKVVLFILICSVCAFGQLDVCKNEKVSEIERVPINTGSIQTINDVIKNHSDTTKTLIIEVQAGTYTGENGVLINRDNVCLIGVGKPTINRTKFDNEKDEPSVIKIYGVSNISVEGFEIQGTISWDNRNVGLAGISVVNFENDKKKGISNIHIEDNLVHSIGQLYEYEKADGYWRYRNDIKDEKYDKKYECIKHNKKKTSNVKISCGHAHGIYVASYQNLISQVFIRNNTLKNLRLGESETITVGERIFNFDVSENTIYDVDNIGIDIAGQQNGVYQSSSGTVHHNTIYDLKGASALGGQNDAYPFVAGIYIDGGTGLIKTPIKIEKNVVFNFGIGISIGSENNYCDKGDDNPSNDICRTKMEYISVENNTIFANQVYGIGVGKDSDDQNSQTWNTKIVGNILYGNNQTSTEKGYSELHFGSLTNDSLKNIEVSGNNITSTTDEAFLVRVKGSSSRPDVVFNNNIFYKEKLINLWSWSSNSYMKDPLFNKDTNISDFPKDTQGNQIIKGQFNYWKQQ